MTNGAVKSSDLEGVIVDHACVGLHLLGYLKGWDLLPCLQSLGGLPVTCMAFWLNASSTLEAFSFSTTLWRGFSGLGKDFVFNYISPTVYPCSFFPNHLRILCKHPSPFLFNFQCVFPKDVLLHNYSMFMKFRKFISIR